MKFLQLLLFNSMALCLNVKTKAMNRNEKTKTMNRMKPYDVPHKGLRNALSQLSLLTGKTDYSNNQEVENLYQLGQDVLKILSIHATDEDEITLTELEMRCPGCSEHDREDHKEIHVAQEKLEDLLSKMYEGSKLNENVTEVGQEFYLALSEFHGVYLEHTAEEERVTQPLLWKHFTDEELAQHRGKIMKRNPPETLLIWFRFVIPAQSHTERVGLLSGFKRMAPPDFFMKGMEVIGKVVPESEFEKLVKELG
jgi:hypothetical protein